MQQAYLVIDIGTGNIRVAVVKPNGTLLGVARGDVQYHRDTLYPESIYFEPEQLWQQLIQLGKKALAQAGNVTIAALTTTSQREGIVLISHQGQALIGLPNIDHRGREWENQLPDKSSVYLQTGRYPTSLFSAFKLVGIRERRPGLWQQLSFFLSISDWVAWQLTGIAAYEHSQASETLLYNVAEKQWSATLCSLFGLSPSLLPPLITSASVQGAILPQVAAAWQISPEAVVVTGGGDTQLAIKSTQPLVEDMVVVSGTTTPVVKLVNSFVTDAEERTWTSCDIVPHRFVLEANAGVTGLNYQRLKQVFYPNEGYEVIEQELAANTYTGCMASLGSLIASEKTPVTRGGFLFPVPVPHDLTRSSFVWATLLDIAFSITDNYAILKSLAGHEADYIWACGGGLQSRALRQLLANSTGKQVRVRHGYEQSSAVGGALLCNQALHNGSTLLHSGVETVYPQEDTAVQTLYNQWQQTRNYFRQTC